MKKYIELAYRFLFLIIGLVSIITHFKFDDENYNTHEFSFFTVQSNIFCFVVMIIILLKYFFKKDIFHQTMIYFKGMATSSIFCTFLVYHFAESCHKYPLTKIGIFGIPTMDLFAHYLVPFTFVLDWIFFQPKGLFKWKYIIYWLLFPFFYFVTFIIRCLCNPHSAFLKVSKFPYFFMNYEKLGLIKFSHFISLILLVFLGVNTLIIIIDKWMYKYEITHSTKQK